MSKVFKFLLISAGILAVLALAAVITLKKMFPPEKIRNLVTVKISENLGREARLGSVEIGLFKGIHIEDFAISESPDFKAGTFVQTKSFTLKFSLWPLLQKKVIVEKVLLESPAIVIVRNRDGKSFNFSNLISTAAPQAPGKKEPESAEGPKAVSLTISQAVLSNGKVEFIDKSPEKIKLTLNPINLTVNGTEISKPMFLDLAVDAKGEFQGKNVAAGLTLKCVLDLLAQRVNVEHLEAKLNELTLSLKGEVKGFANPDLDVSLSIHDINFKSLAKWVSLPKDVSLSGSPSITLGLKGGMKALDCSLDADFSKTELGYSNVFKKDGQLPASLSFAGSVKNLNNVEIKKLALKISNLETSVKGSVQNAASPNPSVKLEVNVGPFDVKEIAGLVSAAKGYDASGKISVAAKAQGPVKSLAYSGAVSLEALKAKYETYLLDGISGSVNFSETHVDIPKLAGKLGVQGKGSADFNLQASVKNFNNPDITLNANLGVLDLGMFMSDKKKDEPQGKPSGSAPAAKSPPYKGPVIKTQGQVKIGKVIYTKFEGQNAEADWKLTGVTPVLDKINGTAKFNMVNGKINKIPLLAALAPILRTDPSALVYSRMGGSMNFTNGTARTNDFQVNSQVADIFVKGAIFLPTNVPDLVLTAKLPKGSIGGTLGEFSNDPEGRPTFAFKMKGNWKPALDTSQVQKKATEELKKKATEVLQKEGQKLLEGIFKR